MDKIKKLAKLNNAIDDLYKQEIIKKVREKYSSIDDEVAILRKMLVSLIEKVQEQHPDLDLTELLEYNNFVETSKRITKTELDLWNADNEL